MHPVSGDISSMSLLAWCLLSPPGSKNCIGFENVDKLALQFPIPHFDQFHFATSMQVYRKMSFKFSTSRRLSRPMLFNIVWWTLFPSRVAS